MTRIVIAHRLATVRSADRIVVLNDGGIEATGRHDELLARSSLYHQLATLQFGSGEAILFADEEFRVGERDKAEGVDIRSMTEAAGVAQPAGSLQVR
jgi:ABC-type multidrug transport system ATPase subunit